jgi:hypothetical protein
MWGQPPSAVQAARKHRTASFFLPAFPGPRIPVDSTLATRARKHPQPPPSSWFEPASGSSRTSSGRSACRIFPSVARLKSGKPGRWRFGATFWEGERKFILWWVGLALGLFLAFRCLRGFGCWGICVCRRSRPDTDGPPDSRGRLSLHELWRKGRGSEYRCGRGFGECYGAALSRPWLIYGAR